MVSLLATVAAATVALTLLAAAVGHLRRPGVLAGALRAHGVLPAGLAPLVAAAAVGVEATLGLGVAAGAAGQPAVGGPSLAAAAVLLAGYAAYAGHVHRLRAAAVPCGCAGSDLPLTGWVVGRAAALAAVALLGWLLAPSVLPMGWHVDVAVAWCASGAFACLLGQLPAAMIGRPAAGASWGGPAVRPA